MLRSFLPKLKRDERGAMMIETAIVAPVLILMSMGAFQVSQVVARQTELQNAAAEASAIISKLRKYQALSQLFAASGKMRATAGLEPDVSALHEISLQQLTGVVGTSFEAWNRGVLPALPVDETPKTSVKQETLAEQKK